MEYTRDILEQLSIEEIQHIHQQIQTEIHQNNDNLTRIEQKCIKEQVELQNLVLKESKIRNQIQNLRLNEYNKLIVNHNISKIEDTK